MSNATLFEEPDPALRCAFCGLGRDAPAHDKGHHPYVRIPAGITTDEWTDRPEMAGQFGPAVYCSCLDTPAMRALLEDAGGVRRALIAAWTPRVGTMGTYYTSTHAERVRLRIELEATWIRIRRLDEDEGRRGVGRFAARHVTEERA